MRSTPPPTTGHPRILVFHHARLATSLLSRQPGAAGPGRQESRARAAQHPADPGGRSCPPGCSASYGNKEIPHAQPGPAGADRHPLPEPFRFAPGTRARSRGHPADRTYANATRRGATVPPAHCDSSRSCWPPAGSVPSNHYGRSGRMCTGRAAGTPRPAGRRQAVLPDWLAYSRPVPPYEGVEQKYRDLYAQTEVRHRRMRIAGRQCPAAARK